MIAIGAKVFFDYPTLNGMKRRVGHVTRYVGAQVEVRMQLGGYVVLPVSEVSPTLAPTSMSNALAIIERPDSNHVLFLARLEPGSKRIPNLLT